MSYIAGLDYSTRAVDVVLLDEDSDRAEWHRFELSGSDAFERARSVRKEMPTAYSSFWDIRGVLAVGIEDPRGYNAGALYRVQGAILACLPPMTLVQPWIPSAWRKQVGLPGNASKDAVMALVYQPRDDQPPHGWPQDACDAYCIALATRSVLQREEAA